LIPQVRACLPIQAGPPTAPKAPGEAGPPLTEPGPAGSDGVWDQGRSDGEALRFVRRLSFGDRGSESLAVLFSNALIDFPRQMLLGGASKLSIAHYAGKYLLIAFHPVDEKIFNDTTEEGGKVRKIVGLGSFDDLLILLGRRTNLIEEELVGLCEISAKTLVELMDQCR
jgi:hypothetical protein